MSSNDYSDSDDDEQNRSMPPAAAAGPAFRSMSTGQFRHEELIIPSPKPPPGSAAIASRYQQAEYDSDKRMYEPSKRGPVRSEPEHADDPEIDKRMYEPSKVPVRSEPEHAYDAAIWCPRRLRQPPAFYPLEKSTRLVEDCEPVQVAGRISECLRNLSVQAKYDSEAATASLITGENIEMHLSLWDTPQAASRQGVLVELQRRKGDSIAFHRYSRSILDAAMSEEILEGVQPLDDVIYSKKVQRLLAMGIKDKELQDHENAILAIEIAHGLLMKDRLDATQLGLESLCLLTDPTKTGYITAVLTAHVVLLGSIQGVHIPGTEEQGPSADILETEGPHQEIRARILSLVQFSKLALDEDHSNEKMQAEDDTRMDIDQEHMTLLHNLALAVLANSLDVIENAEGFEDEPEDTKPSARIRTKSSNDVTQEFMEQAEEFSDKDIMLTLIGELSQASKRPHNATLSAKCLGSLCRASDKARKRAKQLDAKTIVQTALEVGTRTHLKLETECKKVASAMVVQEDNV